MHVTIAHVSVDRVASSLDEEAVRENRPDDFYDGVTRHYGKDREEDVDTLLRFLGDAVKSRGKITPKGSEPKYWFTLDISKIENIFKPKWDNFVAARKKLEECNFKQFVFGDTAIDSPMRDLKAAYDFDDLYIVDGDGVLTIADWLRCIVKLPEYTGKKLYIHATYDGDQ